MEWIILVQDSYEAAFYINNRGQHEYICSVTVASAISLLLVHSGCLRIAVLQQTLWSGELGIDRCVTIYIFCY